jgi:hypothetical protein
MASAVFSSLVASPLSYAGAFRGIGVGDSSKIQIRLILIRERALVRPRGPTKGLPIELETRIQLVKGRLS